MTDTGGAIDYASLGTNMDFKDLILPRDIFSPFHYFFVVHPYFTSFLILDLTLIGIGLVWCKGRRLNSEVKLVIFIYGFLATVAILLVAFGVDHDADGIKTDTRNSISFLAEVVKFRPGLDENKWDLVAAGTNRAFHHNDNKITPYFFYDGAHCHSYFKSWYVEPARVGSARSFKTASVGIQPMIDKALKVYTDSLKDYWRQYMAEINDKKM